MSDILPLVSTTAMFGAALDWTLGGGDLNDSVTVCVGASYMGGWKGHRLCGRGTLACATGSSTGAFAFSVLPGELRLRCRWLAGVGS